MDKTSALELQLYRYRNKINFPKLIFVCLTPCIVLFSSALLFNPFLIACFFLTFLLGWKYSIASAVLMCITAFIVDINYGCEIAILCFVMILSHWFFCFFDKTREYGSPVFICCVLIGITLAESFSLPVLLSSITSSAVMFFVYVSFKSFLLHCNDKYISYTKLSSSCVIATISIITLFYFPIGGVLLRLCLFLNYKDDKEDEAMLSTILSFAFTYYVFGFTSITLINIFIPLLLSLFVKGRMRIVGYILFHFLFSLFIDPIFYLNALFYQGIIAAIFYLIIPYKAISKILHLFDSRTKQTRRSDMSLVDETTRIIEYVSAIKSSLNRFPEEPQNKALSRIHNRVCSHCGHCKNCSIEKDIHLLINEKLSSSNRKRINKDCLYPFKLILELQQCFEIYLSDVGYYQETLNLQQNLKNVLNNIQEPLVAYFNYAQMTDNKKDLVLSVAGQMGLGLNDVMVGEKITLVSKHRMESTEEMKTILTSCFGHLYERLDYQYDWIQHRYLSTYGRCSKHEVSYFIYSKGLENEHNGDSTFIHCEDENFKGLLADGMGHGEKAEQISQKMTSLFASLMSSSSDTRTILEQINAVMRSYSLDDNYSTLDYIEINLETLEARLIKAGACSSIHIHENNVQYISHGGLPIGLLNEIEVYKSSLHLNKEDFVILYSDGLQDFFDGFTFEKYQNFNEANALGRALFTDAKKDIVHGDDLTLIVIKIL